MKNKTFHSYTNSVKMRFVSIVIAALFITLNSNAQDLTVAQMQEKAAELLSQSKPVEALPWLEKIVAAQPNDMNNQFYYAFCLIAKATQANDAAERKQLRIRARNAFLKSKELGKPASEVDGFIQGIQADGSDPGAFSDDPESNAATEAGEKAFTSGKLDEALEHYKRALTLDPKNYHAALFAGDMYLKKDDYSNAEIWYQKAIAIDPFKETAHRYSATPLMKKKKYDQALDRYIEAWIVEPYSKFSVRGMLQWGEATNTKLAHPKIDVPKITVGADGKTNSTVNISPLADDGSIAWIMYVTTRELWRKEKFAKTYPKEKEYRHSLAEEAEALREVVNGTKTFKAKKLNEQIELIAKLDKEGLLESYILMAIPDNGIAEDHAAYVRSNRDKMRQYVKKYVVGAK